MTVATKTATIRASTAVPIMPIVRPATSCPRLTTGPGWESASRSAREATDQATGPRTGTPATARTPRTMTSVPRG
ncbi:hypothetical protein [Serinicoccus marinus]|uniref:hypothetical protein n=1 Tax=Serinicoccus marinus TaxID=247333 RepID=UPI001375CA4D|nr:hypothetical protein [Serinicoccus marinus]